MLQQVCGPVLTFDVLRVANPMLNSFLNWLAHGLLQASVWQIVLYTLVMTHITIIAVTVFLHRSQAHRALDLHPAVMHFFRLWLWLTTGMVTKEWVAIHRKHHAKCETVDDPHSPMTRGISTVLLRGSELYRAESKNQETLAKFGHGTPDDWMERNVYSRFTWQGVGITLIANVLLFGALGASVWAVQMLWIPIWAAGVINGLGHWWGYRNYASRDTSHNVFPWGLVIGGEELHNNHHTYPTSAKLSLKWWEFDMGWVYIRLFSWLGLAKVRKLPPKAKMGALRPHVDLALVQTVITNRYDLMARYARELRRVMQAELLRAQAGIRTQGAASRGQWKALRAARDLITRERETLDAKSLAVVDAAAQNSPLIDKLLHMREDLKAVWGQSSASAEQVRLHLQDWCLRAEQSGIEALQNMSVRLRSYQA